MILNSKALPKTIFLVDDDEDDCGFFTEALNEINVGVTCTICSNGQELMKSLNDSSRPLPDIIFLDLNMPLKNGYDCLKEMRNNEKFEDTPVVIFTTSMLDHDIDRVYSLGASYFVTKPNSFEKLKKIIAKVIAMPWPHHMQPKREKFVLSV